MAAATPVVESDRTGSPSGKRPRTTTNGVRQVLASGSASCAQPPRRRGNGGDGGAEADMGKTVAHDEDGNDDRRMLRLLSDLRSSVGSFQRAVRGTIVAIAVQPRRARPNHSSSSNSNSSSSSSSSSTTTTTSSSGTTHATGGGAVVSSPSPGNDVIAWGYVRSLLSEAPRPGRKSKRRTGGVLTDLHAEADLVASAARDGTRLRGSTVYVSSICCQDCFRLLVGAGVERIVHPPPPSPSFMAASAAHCAALASRHGVQVDADAVLPPHRPPVCTPQELGLRPKECRGRRKGDPTEGAGDGLSLIHI